MARARSLEEFQEAFRDEARCVAFLFERRWPDGFVCPVCGAGRAAALKSRAHTYQMGPKKVIAWLKMLENQSAQQRPEDPMGAYDFTWLWRELGVGDERL